jgi:transposase
MTMAILDVTGGVDTHSNTHHAAAIDQVGGLLGTREFPANPVGYAQLRDWLESFWTVARVGVEGTGSYGAGLMRFLRRGHVEVIEVNRPDRRSRRVRGKSDPLDAESAARRALAGEDHVIPKDTTTIVEAIRAPFGSPAVVRSRHARPPTTSSRT